MTGKQECTRAGVDSAFQGRGYGVPLRWRLAPSLAAAVGACLLGLPAPTGWAEPVPAASWAGPIVASANADPTVYLKVSLNTTEDFRWSFHDSQLTSDSCTEVQVGAGRAEQVIHWKGKFKLRFTAPDRSSWSSVSEPPLTATYLQDGSYSDRFNSSSCGKGTSAPQTDCGKVIRGTGAGSIGYDTLDGFKALWPTVAWQRTVVRCPLGAAPTAEPEELTTLALTTPGFLVDDPVPPTGLIALPLGGSLTSKDKREITGEGVGALGCPGVRSCQAAADFSWTLNVLRYK